MKGISDFFGRTFYALQFGDTQELFEKIQDVLQQLQEMDFIVLDGSKIRATRVGSRVSELYIDPLSAFNMIKGLGGACRFTPFSYLFLFSACSEMMPFVSVGKKREALLWEQLQLRKSEMPSDIDREMFLDPALLRKFNTALLFEQWIEEVREQAIMDDFNIQPGILHAKLRNCEWLCYSALEIAKLLGLEKHFAPLSKLRKRLLHGVREELLLLTEVRHIGRVRARMLWRSNIRAVADLRKVDVRDLGRILGSTAVAEKIKQQLH
jgi:helicase